MLKLAPVKEDKTATYIRANGYLAKGNYNLAAELYWKLIALDEAGDKLNVKIYADILHNLGMIAEKKQEYEAAINYYQKSAQKNEQRSLTWIFLARLYFNRYDKSGNPSDREDAFNALQKAEATPLKYPIIKILKEKYA